MSSKAVVNLANQLLTKNILYELNGLPERLLAFRYFKEISWSNCVYFSVSIITSLKNKID